MLPNIVFAWWNTSLSPTRGKKYSDDAIKREIASSVTCLLASQGVDFIALAEVDDNDMYQFHEALWEVGYQYDAFNGTKKTGKTRFDLGFLYNPEKIAFVDEKFLSYQWATHTLKLALKAEILPYAGERPFSIFLSHWPSPLSKGTYDKAPYGGYLRQEIDKAMNVSSDMMDYVIMMGDFNYEPFSTVLSHQLLATRDRIMASRNQSLLYNPFWRHLGERYPFNWETPQSDDFCGSYFNRRGTINRWHTVDQIMFSSSFLCSKEWYLDEQYSLVWHDDDFGFQTLCDYGFDHFPVTSAVVFNPDMEDSI